MIPSLLIITPEPRDVFRLFFFSSLRVYILTTLGAAAETALEKLILLSSWCAILFSIKASIVSFEIFCLNEFGKTKIIRMATIIPTNAG